MSVFQVVVYAPFLLPLELQADKTVVPISNNKAEKEAEKKRPNKDLFFIIFIIFYNINIS
jgi:hypothetical protein